jgi:hypothetical protein
MPHKDIRPRDGERDQLLVVDPQRALEAFQEFAKK